MDYETALDYIWGLVNFELKPPDSGEPYTPDRMRSLLDRLGDPQNRVPSVHIAGSKGKGSTAAMIESVLRAAGLRTGLYTSPHLYDARERVRIDWEKIPRDHFAALVTRIRPVAERLQDVTTFEFLTALGFLYLAEQEVDISVVEVGLGGRLDATNLIESPLVSVITPVSLEHTKILGTTIPEIAYEKACIIKRSVPVVTAPQEPQALRVIQEVAAERNAPLIQAGARYSWRRTEVSLKGQIFDIVPTPATHRPAGDASGEVESKSLFIPLLGEHQIMNAVTAWSALGILRKKGVAITEDALRTGMRKVSWKGRAEVVMENPLVVVDGAHNGASAAALYRTMEGLRQSGAAAWERLWLVIGISTDKNLQDIIKPFLAVTAGIVLTQANHPRACPPEELEERLVSLRQTQPLPPLHRQQPVEAALSFAERGAQTRDAVVVTGSLFIAAEARLAFGFEKEW